MLHDGPRLGAPVVLEEAFETEELLFVEVVAEHGGEGGAEKEDEAGASDGEVLVGRVGLQPVAQVGNQERQSDGVEDVEAVAVLAVEAKEAVAKEAGGSGAGTEAHRDQSGGAEGKQGVADGEEELCGEQVCLGSEGRVCQGEQSQKDRRGEQKGGESEAEDAVVVEATKKQGQAGAYQERVCAAKGAAVEEVVVHVLDNKGGADKEGGHREAEGGP